jgi:hypothetical protein
VQTAWISGLDDLNLLAAAELLTDLEGELNLAPDGQPVAIKAWNQIIRHVELHPGDGAGIRDSYAERRYKITAFLKEKGVIKDFEVEEGLHRWDNLIVIDADRDAVRQVLDLAASEGQRRRLSMQPKSKPTKAVEQTPAAKAPWSRGDKLTLATLVIAVLGLVAAYLAIPGFQQWIKALLASVRR